MRPTLNIATFVVRGSKHLSYIEATYSAPLSAGSPSFQVKRSLRLREKRSKGDLWVTFTCTLEQGQVKQPTP